MAEMVWCQSCNTVVWAYDHQPKVDLRGVCNILKLPCPKCGDTGNFDGWGDDGSPEQRARIIRLAEKEGKQVYDDWSMLKYIAEFNVPGVKWEISPNCSWFKRPEHSLEQYGDLIAGIQHVVRTGRW